MLPDALFWHGLNLCRAEVNPIIRARLLTIYAIRSAPGDLFEELLAEAYASVDLVPAEFRGMILQEITLALMSSGIL